MRSTLRLVCCLGVIALAGCGLTPSRQEYSAAIKADTVEAYEHYVAKYPEPGFSTDDIYLRLLKKKDSLDAYEDYLRAYPDSRNKSEVQREIDRKYAERAFAAGGASDLVPLLEEYRYVYTTPYALELLRRTWSPIPSADAGMLEFRIMPLLWDAGLQLINAGVYPLRHADIVQVTQSGSTLLSISLQDGTSYTTVTKPSTNPDGRIELRDVYENTYFTYCLEVTIDGQSIGTIARDSSKSPATYYHLPAQ